MFGYPVNRLHVKVGFAVLAVMAVSPFFLFHYSPSQIFGWVTVIFLVHEGLIDGDLTDPVRGAPRNGLNDIASGLIGPSAWWVACLIVPKLSQWVVV